MKRDVQLKVLAKAVQQTGGRAYVVGGAVRDKLRGKSSKDIDVEVFGLSQKALEDLLGKLSETTRLKLNLVGKSFAVYKFGELDISLPRREVKIGDGHKGFEVIPDGFMPEKEACRRRDFTINAMMQDVLTGKILDFYGGRRDLERGIIRHVDENTFVEDSLRVLRAAQFASRFRFNIDNSTVELCRKIDLSDLPKERIWIEMEKLLMQSLKPSDGLFWLAMLGVTRQLFPELHALVGVEQDVDWHPEGNVDIHTALVVDNAALLLSDLPYEKKVTVMLAALCHDFGKAVTTEWRVIGIEKRLTAHGHADAGVALTESFLNRLNLYSINGYDVRSQVLSLVKYHLMPAEFFRSKGRMNVQGAIRRLAGKVELDLLYRVSVADSLGRNYEGISVPFKAEASDWFMEEVRRLKVEEKPVEALFKGRHLVEMGLKPSPAFGNILKKVYEEQLEGRITTFEEAKAFVSGIL